MTAQSQAAPPGGMTKRDALAKASALMKAGELKKAQALYRQIAKAAPEVHQAWDGMGLTAYQMKNYQTAKGFFEKALALKPDAGTYHLRYGVVMRALGDSKAAVQHYTKARDLEPELPGLHGNLGNAYRDLKRYKEAIEAYRQAVADNPDAAGAHLNLAMGLSDAKRFDQALVSLERALELDPDSASIQRELGNIYQELRRHDEAIACYRKAIELDPEDHATRHNLATVLQTLGHLEEAEETYRQALAIRPDFFGSLRQLASVKKFKGNDEEVAAIEQALKSDSMSEEERIDLYFALGKAYDDSKQHERAFRQLQSANQLHRKTLNYDKDKNTQFIDRIMATYDKAFFKNRGGFGSQSERPVFIVGMPRSGTTLTEQIISSHPQVHGAGELMKMHQISSDLPQRLKVDLKYPEAVKLLDKENALAAAQDYLDYLDEHDQEALRVTDKMPFNYRLMGFLALLFPKAKIIHIRRNPLDVCLSCYFVKFKEHLDFSYNMVELGHYYRDYMRIMDHWRRTLPVTWMEIRYEELVANQLAESKQLIDFCGLEWDERCLEFHRNKRPVLTASSWQVRQPLYSSSSGRWRNYDRYLGPLKEVLTDYLAEEPSMQNEPNPVQSGT